MVVKRAVGHPAKVCGQSGNLFIERMVIIIAFPPHTHSHNTLRIRILSILFVPFSRTIALLDIAGTAAVVIRTFGLCSKKGETSAGSGWKADVPMCKSIACENTLFIINFLCKGCCSFGHHRRQCRCSSFVVVVVITCWVGFSLDLILPNLWRPAKKKRKNKPHFMSHWVRVVQMAKHAMHGKWAPDRI